MVRFEDILEKVSSYNPSSDMEVLKKAYIFSGVVHHGQTRLSGEPYLIHPIEVAYILAELKMDIPCVATGLLHDTVEDTHTTMEKIRETFGAEIATLVDGVTKISRMTFEKKEDREAENFRKMILAMSKDIRVILIKLADRLHNMRTLGYQDPEKQKTIARETLDIYAPLANRLGIGWIKHDLEDLAFMHLEPEKYNWLQERVARETEAWNKYIVNVRSIIEEKIGGQGVKGEVTGRLKHIYSIYRKMQDQELDFENIHDIIALRVIVDDLAGCYATLGILHSIWKPVPGRFKDYIALPKTNLYQSLHTTVVGPYGVRMEIQIRTTEMHRVAEYGIASHWKYKEGGDTVGSDKAEYKRYAWLRQLLEWQRDLQDSEEFMDSLKLGLFPEEVFVFTPKGDVRRFPSGATLIDFAYSIHTDVGNRCSGAKVNGRMVPLRTRLKNGDVVEVITSAKHAPSRDWINYVVTSRARNKIRQWIRTEERDRSITIGRELCEKEFSRHRLNLSELRKSGEMAKIANEGFGLKGEESLFAGLGYGKISIKQVIGRILPGLKDDAGVLQKFSLKRVFNRFTGAKKPHKSQVVVRGEGDILVKFAGCCNPLPGDRIAGFITHGQGVSIHSVRCTNLLNVDKERMIDVDWDKDVSGTRPVRIEVICKNEKGMLADMTGAIKTADANISSAEIRTGPEKKAVCTFVVEVRSMEHLTAILRSLQNIKNVLKVARVKGVMVKESAYETAF